VLVEDSFEAGAEQADELRLHGVNACLAAVAARGTEGILRAYFSESTARRHFGALMRELAEARRAYHLVSDDELNRITGSTHHEGVCLVVAAQAPLTAEQWLEDNRRLKQGCVLALEGVGNPHNLGAILRVCAHFGIEAVMVPEARVFLSGAAIRTAEGGAENVTVLDAPAFHDTLQAFRAQGWKIVATSSHTGRDLYKVEFPPKTVLLFGEESAGLSGRAISEGDQCVRIPGTGKVESLNVSVAAGVLLGEWWRQIKG
jgi:TrmH RNA methyltransferase